MAELMAFASGLCTAVRFEYIGKAAPRARAVVTQTPEGPILVRARPRGAS
jgi:hypothetical protein